MTCAIVFAFMGTMVFFALLRRVSLRSSLLVPIMGMMLGAVVSAISTFVALETNTLQSVSVWFQGSFTSVTRASMRSCGSSPLSWRSCSSWRTV